MLLLASPMLVSAQDTIRPQKGDWTIAYTFGKVLTPSSSMQWTLGEGTPVLSNPSPTVSYFLEGSSVSNLNGIKGRYFVSNNFAISLSLAYGQSFVAAKDEMPGVPYMLDDYGKPIAGTGVPFVQSTEEQKEFQVRSNLGVEYHFDTESERLDLYVGGVFNYAISRSDNISRTYLDADQAEAGNYVMRIGAGPRWAESTVLGGGVIAGLDCYLMSDLYIGMEFNVFNYASLHQVYVPEVGLDGLSTTTHNMSAFSYPQLKIGFKL